jgi:hypothetical protein
MEKPPGCELNAESITRLRGYFITGPERCRAGDYPGWLFVKKRKGLLYGASLFLRCLRFIEFGPLIFPATC